MGLLNTLTVLASGQRKRRVPFALLSEHQHEFIERKYHPRGLELKDPHNMMKDDLLGLCNHIRKRQEDHGVADTFRFVQYYC